MNRIIRDKLKAAIKEVKVRQELIAHERDALRELLHDLEDIVDSVEMGSEKITEALSLLEDGVDTMSQFL